VKLYIDGEQVDSQRLRFPKVTEPLTACSIGAFGEFDAAAMAAAAAAAGGTVAFAAAPFTGQLGAVRLFDDVLGGSAVAAMCALGPDYLGGAVQVHSIKTRVESAPGFSA
jgi:hypothetical protein